MKYNNFEIDNLISLINKWDDDKNKLKAKLIKDLEHENYLFIGYNMSAYLKEVSVLDNNIDVSFRKICKIQQERIDFLTNKF